MRFSMMAGSLVICQVTQEGMLKLLGVDTRVMPKYGSHAYD